MTNTLECDAREIARASSHGGRRRYQNAFADDGLDDCPEPAAVVDGEMLKARLLEELLRQAHVRLPVTFARLAERIANSVPSSAEAIRYALERLMDDDAGEGRPLLAAVVVGALKPGLPSPWFFRKARSIGLFVGDPADVEAYAFHAREFHRAIRFHTHTHRPRMMMGQSREDIALARRGRHRIPWKKYDPS
jgi:hypothetical protein